MVNNGDLIKKEHVALFIRKLSGNAWTQIERSTDNTITANPETKTYDFIVDKNPTDVLDKYKYSLSQPVSTYKGAGDYEFFFDLFYNQKVGKDADGEILVVFLGEGESEFKALLSKCMIQIDNYNPVEGVITASISFSGTAEQGLVTVDNGTPLFVGDSTKQVAQYLQVGDGVNGATVEIGGVKKITKTVKIDNVDTVGVAVFPLQIGETYAVTAYDGNDFGALQLTVSNGGLETITIA